MESLAGKFLISTPQMPDPRFREQVIYLCAHSEAGAMGLAVNNLNAHLTLQDVLVGAGLAAPAGPPAPVYIGGPVELEAGFILFRSEAAIHYAMEVQPGVFISRDSRLLEDIAKGEGPEDFLFLLGYAGWGAGQLESELLDNGWLVVPADMDVIFHTPVEEKWKKAAGAFGIDITLLGDFVGNA
ncbi:MAG: YqgE/AlgH family protein [Desulfobulbus sp.]|jgi:putative transcriptional regulator